MLNYHRVSATLTQPSVLQHLQLVHAVLQQMGELRVPVRHMRNSLLLLLDHTWYARLVNRVHSNLWTLRHFNGKNVQKKLQNGLTTWLIDSRQSAAGLSDFFCTHMCYSVVVPPYLLSTNTFGGWEVVTQLAPLSRPWPPLHRPKRSRIGWCVEPLWVDRPLPHEAAKNFGLQQGSNAASFRKLSWRWRLVLVHHYTSIMLIWLTGVRCI